MPLTFQVPHRKADCMISCIEDSCLFPRLMSHDAVFTWVSVSTCFSLHDHELHLNSPFDGGFCPYLFWHRRSKTAWVTSKFLLGRRFLIFRPDAKIVTRIFNQVTTKNVQTPALLWISSCRKEKLSNLKLFCLKFVGEGQAEPECPDATGSAKDCCMCGVILTRNMPHAHQFVN